MSKEIRLSNKDVIKFSIGHSNKSQICDFMDCNYNCKPEFNKSVYKESLYTYNDKYIVLTVTKIKQADMPSLQESYSQVPQIKPNTWM